MEKIDFKKQTSAIIRVANKAPITYLSENALIFRGQRLEINGLTVKSRTFDFNYNSVDSFLEALRDYGLMLNYIEFEKVLKYYRTGNGNTENNGNRT